ncbi:MAG: hypothetical protein OEX07_03465 [Gammaproteobacteria bacterium]|nr:hypothetical protein [Gammaproteobacteria bacterium]
MPRSALALIVFLAIGFITSFIDQPEFSKFTLPLLWFSILGGISCVIWFPFEFVKLALEKERKEEREKNSNSEKDSEHQQ